jgi:hypothetical protein
MAKRITSSSEHSAQGCLWPWFREKQAAELLGIPGRALKHQALRGVVPSFQVGTGRIYSGSVLASRSKSTKRPRRWTRWMEALKRYLSRF